MIDVAVVGMGGWGRYITRSIQGKSEKIRVVRGVDADPVAVSAAAALGVPIATDYEAVIEDAGVQAVILATPHSLHEEQVFRAAQAGKHVFCEKPLALTRASAERMVTVCREAGLVLGVGHERRYESAMEEIARLIEAGTLGGVQHVEANCSHDRSAGMRAEHWRNRAEESPAAGMTGTGVHLTDLFISLVGPIREVFARSHRHVRSTATGDVISVQLEFASGATGLLGASLSTPFHARFAVFGDGGWVEAQEDAYVHEGGESRLALRRAGGKRESRIVAPRDTVRANLEAWADAVSGRAAYRFSDAERVHNVAVLEAIARSIQSAAPEAVAG